MGIVHTDLKHDNIMFDVGPSLTQPADIAALVEADPPRRHPPEESWERIVQVAVTQPFPLPSFSEAMIRNFIISDFGSGEFKFYCPPDFFLLLCFTIIDPLSTAQPSKLPTYDDITAPALRAPEIILQGPWNEMVDIWAFGCLVHFPFLSIHFDFFFFSLSQLTVGTP